MHPLKMSQTDMLIALMYRRWVTALEALHECGCLRLAARIHEIERSHQVERQWVERMGKRYMAYRIAV